MKLPDRRGESLLSGLRRVLFPHTGILMSFFLHQERTNKYLTGPEKGGDSKQRAEPHFFQNGH